MGVKSCDMTEPIKRNIIFLQNLTRECRFCVGGIVNTITLECDNCHTVLAGHFGPTKNWYKQNKKKKELNGLVC
jgi:hypothetical protein